VLAAGEAGDEVAAEIVRSAAEALGSSVGFLVNVLDPELVIVGGGLGLAGGPFWEALVRSTRKHVWSDETRTLPIVPAALGPEAGLIGAAVAAADAVAARR
jgi:glucokinase